MNTGNERRDDSQIMHSLGELTGAVREMNVGLTRRIDDIRADIAARDRASKERMDHMEEGLNRRIDEVSGQVHEMGGGIGKRIDSLGTRVTSLEAEDKRIIEKVAKLSALGGGIGGALAAGLVEIIKRF